MKMSTGKINRSVIFLAATFLLLPAASLPSGVEEQAEPLPSYRYIMVYGSGDLAVGDVVEFFAPEETLCGRFVVDEEGGYGLMAVYADDPQSVAVQEGAREGDYLTIRVNGREVYPVGGPPVWENEGETRRIDL
ncbi:MAG: hypothetical protein P9M08_08785 [Candidatus Erginobacter occultus]|nr:hypothetical protein [Candidatus Erginobacter occultus]